MMGWTHSSAVRMGNDSHTEIKREIHVEGGHVIQFYVKKD
jgi:hypothetical protein